MVSVEGPRSILPCSRLHSLAGVILAAIATRS